MKKIIKKIAILITSVVVVMMIVSRILFKNPLSLLYIPVWIIEARKGIDEEYNKAIKNEETNREGNRTLAEKWLINTYGDIISEATIIEFSNRSQGWGIDSVFHIESPFATGSIYVNSETKVVDGGFNLSSTKFQHMYSEWVKKQAGIDDENVELYFNRASCGSRNIGENAYIDFNSIISLDNLEEQICENTHNLYIRSNHYEQGADVKINNIDNIKEVLNYADLIEKKIRPRIFIDTNHFMPSESNHLFICFLTQSGENDIDIKYDYDSNIKMYRYHKKESDWIEYE